MGIVGGSLLAEGVGNLMGQQTKLKRGASMVDEVQN